jgi:tetratricopeptide (TPR) repeat protein
MNDSQADDETEYRKLLASAIECREDGDLEDSVSLFKTLKDRFSSVDFFNGKKVSLEYALLLKKLGRYQEADKELEGAIEIYADDFDLRKAWSEVPLLNIDHEELRKRGRTLRSIFSPEQYPQAWRSLVIELDGFYESGQWEGLESCIDENWNNFQTSPDILPQGVEALNKLFLSEKMKQLVLTADKQAFKRLPAEAVNNLLLLADTAMGNREKLRGVGASVISIGQNCLPYLLYGRWGLISSRAKTDDLTMFDLGAFKADMAAEVIANGFAEFSAPEQFVVTNAWGGGKMFSHKKTGIGFFHERGSFWLGENQSRFFSRLNLMISNWFDKSQAEQKKIFVFCLCGAVNLDRLVSVADKYILGPNSKLLIIDVLKEPHVCPAHERVVYVHTPYPDNYNWVSIAHYSSDRGVKFELSVVNPLLKLLDTI